MSATAEVLIRDLAARGVRLSRCGDKLRVVAPKSVVTDELRRVLAANKPRLMVALSGTTSPPAPRAVVHFRLIDDASNAWATCLGAPSESIDSILRDLRARHGDRLAECRPRLDRKEPQ
jgi:hypothetical protein